VSRVAAIVAEAAQLDDTELKLLFEKLQALSTIFAASAVTKPVVLDKAGEMYRTISNAVYKARAVRPMPLAVFKARREWARFVQAADEAEQFIESLEKDRIKQIALRRHLCRLMVKYLNDGKRPLHTNSFVWGLNNIQIILDHYFPGYMASGHMPLVLSMLYRGTKKKLEFPA
jgi:hypothetical protein